MIPIPSEWIGKAIYLEFNDPCSYSRWEFRKEIISQNLMKCASVGFLLHVDEEKVVLCLSRSEEDDLVSDSFIIPRACVTDIKRLCEP